MANPNGPTLGDDPGFFIVQLAVAALGIVAIVWGEILIAGLAMVLMFIAGAVWRLLAGQRALVDRQEDLLKAVESVAGSDENE